MRKVLSFILIITMLASTTSLPVYGETTEFLSDEMAQTFVDLFYETESYMAQSIADALTGKTEATDEQLEEIYDNALAFYDILDQQELLTELTKGTAAEKLSTYNKKISFAVNLVSGAVEIYNNAKSFSESENCMQKTVDALQIGYQLLESLNLNTYIPSSISLALSSVEAGLAIGGILELAYLEENYTLYEYELSIAYYTDEELPYRTAPTLALGSSITQEQADAKYAILYMQYRMKQILKGFPGYESGDSAPTDSYTITFNSNCSEVSNITQEYKLEEETVTFPDMTRPGYIFDGWYTESSCQNPVGEFEKTNQTFYAKWIAIYKFSVSNSKVTITGYNIEPEGQLEIPSTINGYPVTIIGEDAFSDCDLITSVIIPDTVTDIKRDAFWHNDLLENVDLGNGVINIETDAFYNCDSIKNIIIPDSAINIGGFEHCDSLETLVLGKNVASIKERAFAYCISLKSVEFKGSLERIPSYVFMGCSSLAAINIPDGVTYIGSSAFMGCSALAEVGIPDSVTTIGGLAFSGCTSLKEITIPSGVTELYQATFDGCSSLESVEIHEGIEKIGQYAFRNCVSLTAINVDEKNSNYTSVDGVLFDKAKTKLIQYPCGKMQTNYVIPDGVTNIESYAFYMCKQLKDITIPDSLTYIGYDAFMDCSNLERVHIVDLAAWCGVGINNTNASPMNYAKEVYLSGELATDITIPDNVNSIGKYTFYKWRTLKNVTVSSNVSEIGNSAFYSCVSLEKVELSDGLTTIGSHAFYCCTALADISIPDSVQSIGGSAFSWCGSLKSVTIGGGVTKISSALLAYCRSLESITVNDGVEVIDAYAFCGNSALKWVRLPESLTTIKYSAFEESNNLTDIYYEGSYVDWQSVTVEEDCNSAVDSATIHFNKLLVENISVGLSTNNTINCELELSPYDNKSVTIYSAIYDGAERLVIADSQEQTLDVVNNTVADISVTTDDISEDYTFAVFVWNDKLKPCIIAQKYVVKSDGSDLELVKME